MPDKRIVLSKHSGETLVLRWDGAFYDGFTASLGGEVVARAEDKDALVEGVSATLEDGRRLDIALRTGLGGKQFFVRT